MKHFTTRSLLSLAVLLYLIASLACADSPAPVDLTQIDRTIVREPKYDSQPHYALLVFGMKAENLAWFVIDGDSVAYIDRNGNGDLTEPAERIERTIEPVGQRRNRKSGPYLAMHKFPLGTVFGAELSFRLWVRDPNYDDSQDSELLRERHREFQEKGWVNGTLTRQGKDRINADNPLLLTLRPEEAQISRFKGPLTFALNGADRATLEPWPKRSFLEINIGCSGLLAKDCRHQGFGFTTLTTTEVPAEAHPVAKLEFSPDSATGTPRVETLTLDQRCCGDRFSAALRMPRNYAGNEVKITVTMPDGAGLSVRPAEFQVSVNRGLDGHNEEIYVFFRDPDLGLKQAVNVLRKRGLDVEIDKEWLQNYSEKDLLRVHSDEEQWLIVRLNRSDEVHEIAAALGENTSYADQLRQCGARFEIPVTGLKRLSENGELIREVQTALQGLTHGFVYQTWNQELLGPK